MAMQTSERCIDLAELQIDAACCGSQLAWCSSSNLVAVSSSAGERMQVILLDPEGQQVVKVDAFGAGSTSVDFW